MRTALMRVLVVIAVVITVGATGTLLADARKGDGIARVRSATSRFHRLKVAERAGYGRFKDAAGVACIEDPGGSGAMGVHYVNGDLVGDGVIDAVHPEALLYDKRHRKPRLLGVEYVVLVSDWGEYRDPPTLFGREFMRVDEPNRYGLPPFYELHAWIWKKNPSGMFADWNPRIDCPAAGTSGEVHAS